MTTGILLRGGCILTLGTKTQNLKRGDVLIEDGRIAEVGTSVRGRDAEVVDATDAIVMPGFVDTHRHAWTSLFRNAGDIAEVSPEVLGEHYRPEDVYAATLIGLLGAIEAGITTVVDVLDLPLRDGFAEAALQAHADSGVRTVFAFAAREAAGDMVDRLSGAAGPGTTFALVSDGFGDGWTGARDRGLRVFVHARPTLSVRGDVARAASEGLLSGEVTLVHHTALDDSDLDAIAGSGACVSLTPSSEMATGFGSPPIQELIDRRVKPGLGIDREGMAPGDMFAQMRQTISLQHATVFDRKLAGKAGLPRLMTTRDVIRFATSEGARVAGVREVTGSLEPGLQADIIVLRTDRPNVWPINDPIGAVVWGMDTSNIDHVFVGGRPVMRSGVLAADVARARSLATGARGHVTAAAGIVARAVTGATR